MTPTPFLDAVRDFAATRTEGWRAEEDFRQIRADPDAAARTYLASVPTLPSRLVKAALDLPGGTVAMASNAALTRHGEEFLVERAMKAINVHLLDHDHPPARAAAEEAIRMFGALARRGRLTADSPATESLWAVHRNASPLAPEAVHALLGLRDLSADDCLTLHTATRREDLQLQAALHPSSDERLWVDLGRLLSRGGPTEAARSADTLRQRPALLDQPMVRQQILGTRWFGTSPIMTALAERLGDRRARNRRGLLTEFLARPLHLIAALDQSGAMIAGGLTDNMWLMLAQSADAGVRERATTLLSARPPRRAR